MNRIRSTKLRRWVAGLLLVSIMPLLAPSRALAGRAASISPVEWLRSHFNVPTDDAIERALEQVGYARSMTIESILNSFYRAYSNPDGYQEETQVLTEAFDVSDVGALILQSRLVGMMMDSVSLRGTSASTSGPSGRKTIPRISGHQVHTAFHTAIQFKTVNLESVVDVVSSVQFLTDEQPLGP